MARFVLACLFACIATQAVAEQPTLQHQGAHDFESEVALVQDFLARHYADRCMVEQDERSFLKVCDKTVDGKAPTLTVTTRAEFVDLDRKTHNCIVEYTYPAEGDQRVGHDIRCVPETPVGIKDQVSYVHHVGMFMQLVSQVAAYIRRKEPSV